MASSIEAALLGGILIVKGRLPKHAGLRGLNVIFSMRLWSEPSVHVDHDVLVAHYEEQLTKLKCVPVSSLGFASQDSLLSHGSVHCGTELDS